MAVLSLALIVGVVWLIWFSSVLDVRGVKVSGETTMKAEQIEKAAKVPLGEPLASVDLTEIETRVKQLPRIRTVDVSRSWPHTISIEVEERTTVMWLRSEGEIHGVDRYGVDFRTYDKAPDNTVEARITGFDADVRLQAIQATAKVAAFLRDEKPEWSADLRTISAGTQDSITLGLTKGRTVVWGSPAQGARKLEVLQTLLSIKAKGYDVSAPDQPTTKN